MLALTNKEIKYFESAGTVRNVSIVAESTIH